MKNFLSGLAFFALGVFLITQNTIVRTGLGLGKITGGFNPPFGVLVLPILIGVILLFAMKNQVLGWIVTAFGICTLLLSILMGLEIYFIPTSLYITILMFGLVAVGIGLMIRGISESNSKTRLIEEKYHIR